MKKGLKLFATGFVAMSALAWNVNAEEVTDYESLNSCVSKTGNTCTLKNDVEFSGTLNVTNGVEVTIDLNGNDITSETDTVDPLFKINNGSLEVTGKGTITSSKDTFSLLGNTTTGGEAIKAELEIGSNVEVVSNSANCVFINGKGAKVDVYGSLTSKGTYAVIQGNGSVNDKTDNGNTEINIYEGAKVTHETDLAIYHPQSGTLTVNGGTITGTTGIEMRAGNLVVKGGTITGTYIPTEFDSNGNGSTTLGAGIAIAQHRTKLPVNVKVSGGTIEGYTALHEVNTENSTAEELAKITLEVTGGTFNAINEGTKAVYSQNKTAFISGGEFNTAVDSTYLIASTEESNTDVYEVVTPEGETKYVVADEEELVEAPYVEKVISDKEELAEEIEALDDFIKLLEENVKELETSEDADPEELKVLKNNKEIFVELKELLADRNVVSLNNIVYGSYLDDSFVKGSDETTELTKNVKVTLELPENLEKLKEGYTRKYSVIRLHTNDDGTIEISKIDKVDENKDGTVTFETDRFSTYVLTYEDTKKTTNPDTGDNMLMYFATAIISVIGLALTTLRITKKQK